MKTADTKEQFIILRAQGYSFRRIAEELKISTATAQDWEDKFHGDIERLKADELTALYEQYHATKQERIKAIGANLQEIERIMKEKDVFNALPPAQLLNYHIKYLQLLKDEYEPANPEKVSLSATMAEFSLS